MTQQESSPARPPFVDVQTAVDRMLITHGTYIPVELLLDLGWLRYSDYEAWRCGEQPSLGAALAGDARDVVLLLQEAARWAETLSLEAEPQVYFGWGDCAGRRLVLGDGRRPATDTLLATHYVPPAGPAAGQLDIFTHSAATAALAALRSALRARDPAAAVQALVNLRSKAPEHRLLPAAAHLTGALAGLSRPLSPDAVESELAFLEQVLEPAAREVLGPDARGVLGPFWRRLANALADRPFDPQRPSLHASYAYMRCHDWGRSVAVVLETPAYAGESALLARLAEARRRDGDRNGAIGSCCLLCWRFPAAAGALLDNATIPDGKLREAWIEFRDRDLDPPPESALFPAYLLLSEPGLARALPSELAAGDSDGERAFRAVRRLLCRDDIEARKALRAAAPWLLECYLGLHGGHGSKGNCARKPE
ncbi:MAG: hypothetical protein ACREQZ_04005 [Woeseiaceae bacterium]